MELLLSDYGQMSKTGNGQMSKTQTIPAVAGLIMC